MTALRSILRGAAPLAVLELLSLLLALITLPYLMRVLGPTEFGRYAFGVAAGGVLGILVDWGFNQAGPRAVARAEAGTHARVFWTVQFARLQPVLVALPLLVLLAWLLGLLPAYGAVLLPALAAVLSALLFPQWFLQGLQRYRTVAMSMALARTAAAAATLALVNTADQAALAVWLQTGAGAVAGLLALADPAYRAAARFVRPRVKDCAHELRQATPLFLSTVAVSVYTICVPIIIGVLAAPAAVGYYSAGDKVRAAVQSLLAPIGVAAFPQFSRQMHGHRAEGLRAARRLLTLQVLLGLAASAAILVLAEPVIRRFVGEQFLPAVPAAQLLGLCIVAVGVSNTLGMQIMLPLEMERTFAAILGACAALGLLATALCCLWWQATGAAAAVLGTEVLVALAMAVTLRRRNIL